MNRMLAKQIDDMISNVNNITDGQLKGIDLHYIKVKRVKQFIVIMGIFDGVFLARLKEETNLFYNLTFPNKLWKCYAVIVIDVDRAKYITHRLYSFPTNIEIYLVRRIQVSRTYREIMKQLENNPMKIIVKTSSVISSKVFRCTVPISNLSSHYFDIIINQDRGVYFDIDNYVDNYVKVEGNNVIIKDTFYGYRTLTKGDILNAMTCTCQKVREDLRYACFSCDNAVQRSSCSRHHVRKCQCKSWTYFRQDNCIKCHIIYSKAKYLDQIFYENGDFNMSLVATQRSLSNYIPYFHYNQNANGICLGGGSQVITDMVKNDINPIRLMLAFKANLSFTDHRSTTNYYRQYRDRLEPKHFDNSVEFHAQLVNIFNRKKSVKKSHTFSTRCFCPQCFYYRICLYQENIKLDIKGFDDNFPPIVTRDEFIKFYKQYIERNKSKTYISTYIHKMIKQLTNTQYSEFIKA